MLEYYCLTLAPLLLISAVLRDAVLYHILVGIIDEIIIYTSVVIITRLPSWGSLLFLPLCTLVGGSGRNTRFYQQG